MFHWAEVMRVPIVGGIVRNASAIVVVPWRVGREVATHIAGRGGTLTLVIKALPHFVDQHEVLPVRHRQSRGPHQREDGLLTSQTK